ncbi:MAG: protein-glutamate O-methyltransferase CheR, partial [Chitinophagales bacterium]|nr:protein-glutamate O-methyltransferase CheR [Chitinophagales bacterium]
MELESEDVKKFLELVRTVYGYDFTDYAEASIKRRILHFMLMQKMESLEQMQLAILQDEKLFEVFVQEVSVTVTE